ncbi:MAG: UDP-N-acetylmuramoyl-L-alanine--D-glutamate ligase [Desulfosudaceae bacterium]
MIEVRDKRFLVVGMGATGLAVAKYLVKRGATVTITDQSPDKELGESCREARELGVTLELGGHTEEVFRDTEYIVISPGVPTSLPQLRRAAEAGIPVLGEIELAASFMRKPLVAVTGTNGKTTVTTLIGEMLKKSGRHVFVGGNIGRPLISFADKGENADVAVVELSSFQLETIVEFRAGVAVLLNIAEDHLDRHEDLEGYVEAKKRIFENQLPEDAAVINGSDFHVLKASKDAVSRKICFNGGRDVNNGAVSGDGFIDIVRDKETVGRINVASPYLRMPHNMENLAAAVLASLEAGGTMAGIQEAANEFKGLPHRLEYVDMVNNVAYIDDSKATNPDAVRRALECLDCPVVLLMGGENKGCDFGVLKNVVREHAKAAVLLGEAGEAIRLALDGAVTCRVVDTMKEAVGQASSLAGSGEVVLLSPACSSFDAYDNYAQRGQDFRRAVEELKIKL